MTEELTAAGQSPAECPAAGDTCWYCKSAAAGARHAAEAQLYRDVRIKDVQSTAIG